MSLNFGLFDDISYDIVFVISYLMLAYSVINHFCQEIVMSPILGYANDRGVCSNYNFTTSNNLTKHFVFHP